MICQLTLVPCLLIKEYLCKLDDVLFQKCTRNGSATLMRRETIVRTLKLSRPGRARDLCFAREKPMQSYIASQRPLPVYVLLAPFDSRTCTRGQREAVDSSARSWILGMDT